MIQHPCGFAVDKDTPSLDFFVLQNLLICGRYWVWCLTPRAATLSLFLSEATR
jgi:hypothetical protein